MDMNGIPVPLLAPRAFYASVVRSSGLTPILTSLEKCLIPNVSATQLANPLTGLVFHYDSFTSAVGGQACEAAYLCSSEMQVTVLVSPSNLTRMISIYQNLPGLAAGRPRVNLFYSSRGI